MPDHNSRGAIIIKLNARARLGPALTSAAAGKDLLRTAAAYRSHAAQGDTPPMERRKLWAAALLLEAMAAAMADGMQSQRRA